MNKDVIKPKFFHVQEEFYEQLINGFREDAKQQAAKAKSMPVKMVSKHATYFKRTTMPLIMKSIQRQKLLEDFYVEAAQQRKKSVIEELRGKFLKGQQEVQQVQQEIQVQQKKAERRGFLGKMLKIAKYYDNVMTIISIYKKSRERATKTEVFLGLDKKYDWLQNPQYKRQLQKKIYAAVNDQSGLMVSTMTNVMTPVMGGMFDMIDQKVGGLWRSMLMMIVEKFLLPDWDDPIDVALWAVQMGLTALSFVLTATGIGAPAGAAIGATVWAARLAKVMKIFKSIKGMSTVFKQGRRVRRIGRAWARGSRVGRATVRLSQWGRGGLVNGLARIRTLRRQYKSYMNGTYDILFGITTNDVAQMRRGYETKSRAWGEQVQKIVGRKLEGVASDVSFIQQRLADAGAKLVQGIRTLHATGGIYKPLEKIYGTTLTLQFSYDLQYPSLFDKLTNYIQKNLINLLRNMSFPRIDLSNQIHLNKVFDSSFKKVENKTTGKTFVKRGDIYYYDDGNSVFRIGKDRVALFAKNIGSKLVEQFGYNKIFLYAGKFRFETIGAEILSTYRDTREWFEKFKKIATDEQVADFRRFMQEKARQHGWEEQLDLPHAWYDKDYYLVSPTGADYGLQQAMNALHQYGLIFLLKKGVINQTDYNNYINNLSSVHELQSRLLSKQDSSGERSLQQGSSSIIEKVTNFYEHGFHAGVVIKKDNDFPSDMKYQLFVKGKFYKSPTSKWEFKNYTDVTNTYKARVIKDNGDNLFLLPIEFITMNYDIRGKQVTLITKKEEILQKEKDSNKQIDTFKKAVQIFVKNHMTMLETQQRKDELPNG